MTSGAAEKQAITSPAAGNGSRDAVERLSIDELVRHMTLEEKLAQLGAQIKRVPN